MRIAAGTAAAALIAARAVLAQSVPLSGPAADAGQGSSAAPGAPTGAAPPAPASKSKVRKGKKAGPGKGAPATGAAKPDPTVEEARQHLLKARSHYGLGEYLQAAEEFKIVYRLKPLPQLLFNVAQSYRQAGDLEKALQFFRAYQRERPSDPPDARPAIAEIEAALAKQAGAAAPATGAPGAPAEPAPGVAPPAPGVAAAGESSGSVPAPTRATTPVPAAAVATTTAAPSSSSNRRLWTYGLAGASAVLLTAGTLYAVKASHVDSELQAHPHLQATADDLLSQSKSSHTLSAVFLISGVAAGAGAGILYFLPTSSGGGSVNAAGHF